MDIKPIKSNADYETALARLDALMDAEFGSERGDELDVLATLIEAYERKTFPIEPADPVEAIVFRMEQSGLERKDLEPLIGSRARVSEILNRKRDLSLAMIRRLHDKLNIPYECLIKKSA